VEALAREGARREARAQALDETIARLAADHEEAAAALAALRSEPATSAGGDGGALDSARSAAQAARNAAAAARSAVEAERRDSEARVRRAAGLTRDHADWSRRSQGAVQRLAALEQADTGARAALAAAQAAPQAAAAAASRIEDELTLAERRRRAAADAFAVADHARVEAERAARAADARAAAARETRAGADARLEAAQARLDEALEQVREVAGCEPDALARRLAETAVAIPPARPASISTCTRWSASARRSVPSTWWPKSRRRSRRSASTPCVANAPTSPAPSSSCAPASASSTPKAPGASSPAFDVVNGHFRSLFTALFDGGEAELKLVESDDPLEAGLEIYACPPGKRMATMSLMSGGEQALTATALIFAVFLAAPAPVCVLDEVDAPLDDANVDRFCNLLDEMRRRSGTRFIVITHNAVTMSRMDRLFGVTMAERGVSQLVSVDLRQAEILAAE
jgi:chromosome segregation protein